MTKTASTSQFQEACYFFLYEAKKRKPNSSSALSKKLHKIIRNIVLMDKLAQTKKIPTGSFQYELVKDG